MKIMDEITEAAPVASMPLVLEVSNKKAALPFASTSSVREFVEDDRLALCADPATSPRIQKLITTGNFKSLSWCNGGFAQQVGDPSVISIGSYNSPTTPTNGWNAVPPVNPVILQGDLAKTYTKDGNMFDFFGAHNAMRKMMDGGNGANSFIIANILKGTVEGVLTQIDCTDQQIIYILFGEEIGSEDMMAADYARKCIEWANAIETARPNQTLRFGFYVPTIYLGGKKVEQWIDGIFTVYGTAENPIDKKKWFIDQYFHLFKYVELSGNISQDVAEIDKFFATVPQAYSEAIEASKFAGHRVFIGQVSANDFSGTAYSSPVTENIFFLAACYARFTKFFLESFRDEKTKFIGQCYIGMNQWIKKNLEVVLDYKFVRLLNRQIGRTNKILFCSGWNPAGVDIQGTFYDGIYYLTIQNRTGSSIPFPESITLDGVTKPFLPHYCEGVYCNGEGDKNGYEYNPNATRIMLPYSLQTFEVN